MVLLALIKKEVKQLMRDPGSILTAFILPLMLLFIYMYGIRLDNPKIVLGVINENPSYSTGSLVSSLNKNGYILVRNITNRQQAYIELNDSKISGIIVIPSDFDRNIVQGNRVSLQLITDGSESNKSHFVQNYVNAILYSWYHLEYNIGDKGFIEVHSNFLYNQEVISQNSILPGSLAITMTVIGILLTGLVVAREWERGTMESLLAAGVGKLNLVLGKYIPYYIVGMLSLFFNITVCILFFEIPFRGSLFNIFLFGSLFLLTCLGLGLLISTKLKTQLLAGQMTFVIGFLPSLLLCGLIFPVQSMPIFFQYLTKIIPARYFVILLQNEFLVGGGDTLILGNSLYLLCLSVILFVFVYISTPKHIV